MESPQPSPESNSADLSRTEAFREFFEGRSFEDALAACHASLRHEAVDAGISVTAAKVLFETTLGCMLGLACGDALGAAVENLDFDAIAARFPGGLKQYHVGVPGSLLEGLAPGTYTDDTVMSLGLARAYLQTAGTYSSERVAAQWVEWKQKGPYWELGPGMACDQALSRLIAEFDPSCSGVEGSAGNGTAMRVASVGILRRFDLEACTQEAVWQSRITHVHPEADAGAACMAQAIAFLVRNHARPFRDAEFWDLLKLEARKHSPKFHLALEKASSSTEMPRNVSGYVTETFPAACRIFLVHRQDFEGAIRTAARAGGDTDTLAALVGGMAGAYLGISKIPSIWLEGLRGSLEVVEVACDLWSLAIHQPHALHTSSQIRAALDAELEDLLAWKERYAIDLPGPVRLLATPLADPQTTVLALRAMRFEHETEWESAVEAYQHLADYLRANQKVGLLKAFHDSLEQRARILVDVANETAGLLFELAYEHFAVEPVPLASWLDAAEAIGRAGNWAKALSVLKTLKPAIERRDEDAESDEARMSYYLTLGNVLIQADDDEGAERSHRTCIALALEAEGPMPLPGVKAFEELGHACRRAGELSEALGYYDQAFELCPPTMKRMYQGLLAETRKQLANLSQCERSGPLMTLTPSNVPNGYRVAHTMGRKKPFYVAGSIQDGIRLRFNNGSAAFSAQEWSALFKHFAAVPSVAAGTSRDNPPVGSLGAYLMETKGQNLASYLLPLLSEDGLIEVKTAKRSLIVTFTEKFRKFAHGHA